MDLGRQTTIGVPAKEPRSVAEAEAILRQMAEALPRAPGLLAAEARPAARATAHAANGSRRDGSRRQWHRDFAGSVGGECGQRLAGLEP